ncbi:DUF6519 domain-containing protein [Paractinoplanes durhamensis]|uniref:DUF6519 domain-containing protein n=1 Tax=Paractinoplanes durhamensis TaxID=113563 RepID=UPI003627CD1C
MRLSAEPGPHSYLRRWESGAVTLKAGRWLPLEDGVEVYFRAGDFTYATGDYWLIPARTVTGDVEWPRDAEQRPMLIEPAGPAVSYAPLAWVTGPGEATDLRLIFDPLAPQPVEAAAPKRKPRRKATEA